MNDLLNRRTTQIHSDGTWELPEEVLVEVRISGLYDEITIDPVDGRVLSRFRVQGVFDSYTNTYILNGQAWKIESKVNLPGGRTLCCLVPVTREV